MLYGLTASEMMMTTGAAGYTASAVHFSGVTGANVKCAMSMPSVSCTDNGFFGWSGWFKTDWYPSTGTTYPNIFMCDATGNAVPNFHRNGSTQWEFDGGNATSNIAANIGASDSLTYLPTSDTAWRHIICACDVNHNTLGAKFLKIYVDDVDATANISGTSAAWTFIQNGKDFWLGDDGYGSSWLGDVADFSLWPGISLLTAGDISPTTRALFRDPVTYKPVNPATAIASLGAPAIMCTGGVSGFLANSLGSSGVLTVPGGYDSPTAASTHP